MPTHSSTLAWKIPWTEEPAELQSMGSQESQTHTMQGVHKQTIQHQDKIQVHQHLPQSSLSHNISVGHVI